MNGSVSVMSLLLLTGFSMMIVYVLEELPFEIGLPLFALGLIYRNPHNHNGFKQG